MMKMDLEDIEDLKDSKPFKKYMNSQGVKEYKHFGMLGDDYVPSIPDVAMFLYESRGKAACTELGVEIRLGHVFINGDHIGFSELSKGKSWRDLTITMWLEDISEYGFSFVELEKEIDNILGEGWFKNNVRNQVTMETINASSERIAERNMARNVVHYEGFELWKRKLKQFISDMKFKIHYRKFKKVRGY